jgi:aryl-alcohol dehydrogenase-like predicted oxidoreductase
VQLHCPPTEVYYMPEVFDALDKLTAKGKIEHYGVSVEKVEEALKAIEFPNVKSV